MIQSGFTIRLGGGDADDEAASGEKRIIHDNAILSVVQKGIHAAIRKQQLVLKIAFVQLKHFAGFVACRFISDDSKLLGGDAKENFLASDCSHFVGGPLPWKFWACGWQYFLSRMETKTFAQATPKNNADYHGALNGSVHDLDSSNYGQPRQTTSNFSRHSLISNGATDVHIDSVAGFSLPPTTGSNVRVKFIFDFDQTVSAFDSCEWLVKYFRVFRARIPPHIKDEYKDPSVPYEEFMNEVFHEFHTRGKDVNDLLNHMRRLPLMDGYLQLFTRVRKDRNLFEPPVILSDSFVPLIKSALLGNGIDADATNLRVLAHYCQTSVPDNSKIAMFHAHGLMNQSQCSSCPTRLCKGLAMSLLFPFLQFVPSQQNCEPSCGKEARSTNLTYNPPPLTAAELATTPNNLRIMYSGDGRNDFCALKSLRECDIGMYKLDSPLAALVASRSSELRCRVFGWENAFDILRVLDEKVLAKH